MTSDSPTVRLDLESRPQTLTIVRGMLGGVADLLSIDPELLDDLKTAVSEACNNVVLHAYEGRPGPMGVRLFLLDDRIRVTVRDEGVGMSSEDRVPDRTDGIGLSVIRALTEEVHFATRPGGGTEVVMDFPAHQDGGEPVTWPSAEGPDSDWALAGPDEIVLSLSPVTLLGGVLGRLARTLAATAHFSLDRFSDVYLVTDTIAAHATGAASGGRISARLAAKERRLELAVGPFKPGSGASLCATSAGRPTSPLMLLSDEVSVRREGDDELLYVVVIDPRAPT